MKPKLTPATDADYLFAFAAKKDAMGEHIASRWGWDDDYQLAMHKLRWTEKPWFIVMWGEKKIGTVSIHEQCDYVRFGEFYLLSDYRAKGIGSIILSEFLGRCDRSQRIVQLEYLKWNPVASLYKRHGFEIIAQNDIHYFMERNPLPI